MVNQDIALFKMLMCSKEMYVLLNICASCRVSLVKEYAFFTYTCKDIPRRLWKLFTPFVT